MRKSKFVTAIIMAVMAFRSYGADLDLKPEVKKLWGKPGPRHVSGGVLLLPGQASEAILTPGKGKGTFSGGGYLYICDHWLLTQPPRPEAR